MKEKNTMTKDIKNYKSFNVVYQREYFSDEDTEWFLTSYSMYKNVPIEKLSFYKKQLSKFKKIMDESFKEDATNFTGYTTMTIIYPDEYYQTYEDVFGPETAAGDHHLFNDYGQLYKRQGFRKDFDPDLTKSYSTKREYITQLN